MTAELRFRSLADLEAFATDPKAPLRRAFLRVCRKQQDCEHRLNTERRRLRELRRQRAELARRMEGEK